MRENIKFKTEQIINALQLPKDVLKGDIRISVTGNREVFIENYKGLLEYDRNSILIQAKNCKILFEGRFLTIDYYTNEDMKLTGKITCIKYL